MLLSRPVARTPLARGLPAGRAAPARPRLAPVRAEDGEAGAPAPAEASSDSDIDPLYLVSVDDENARERRGRGGAGRGAAGGRGGGRGGRGGRGRREDGAGDRMSERVVQVRRTFRGEGGVLGPACVRLRWPGVPGSSPGVGGGVGGVDGRYGLRAKASPGRGLCGRVAGGPAIFSLALFLRPTHAPTPHPLPHPPSPGLPRH